jgi:hypothetical protein
MNQMLGKMSISWHQSEMHEDKTLARRQLRKDVPDTHLILYNLLLLLYYT